MFINIIFISILFFIFYYIFYKVSFIVNLLDHPTERKKHFNETPLIGGLVIFFTLASLNFYNNFNLYENLIIYSFFILFIGLLDDKFNLNPYSRFLLQIIICIAFISNNNDIEITDLGNYAYIGQINLHHLSLVFTILCIVATINSINFIDGIDGYASFKSCLIFLLIIFYNTYFNINDNSQNKFLLYIIIIVFLFFLINSRIIKLPQIFLGDAGSNFLGFLIAINLIYSYNTLNFHPLAFAWIISIPIFELLSLFIIRIIHKRNPFKPDQNHLHFYLLKKFGNRYTIYLSILVLFLTINVIGFTTLTYINSLVSLLLFLIFFIIYSFVIYRNFR